MNIFKKKLKSNNDLIEKRFMLDLEMKIFKSCRIHLDNVIIFYVPNERRYKKDLLKIVRILKNNGYEDTGKTLLNIANVLFIDGNFKKFEFNTSYDLLTTDFDINLVPDYIRSYKIK